jgi:predicted dienelactone hydrolase
MKIVRLLMCATSMTAIIAGTNVTYAASTYKVGQSSRVFHPGHARNWRAAKTEVLISTIWYPVSADATGVLEQPRIIGDPGHPLFEAGDTAVDAPISTTPKKFPVVMLSHGTGGSAMQLAWLGTQLARHGYIAVEVNHPGNNALEPYTAEGFVLWWERAIDPSDALDGLMSDSTFGPHVDTARVGAAGFSIGGYTVLELAGARTDQERFFAACETDTTLNKCRVPEMKETGEPEQCRVDGAWGCELPGSAHSRCVCNRSCCGSGIWSRGISRGEDSGGNGGGGFRPNRARSGECWQIQGVNAEGPAYDLAGRCGSLHVS